jgi:AraC-like DNA-binding protein
MFSYSKEKLEKYFKDNIANCDLSISQMTEELKCYKDYLYEMCNDYFDMTPCEYLETIRLRKGIQILFNAENKICSQIGYKSKSNLSKALERRTGYKLSKLKNIINSGSNREKEIFIEKLLKRLEALDGKNIIHK